MKMVEDTSPVLRLIANACLVAKIQTCAAVASHVARAEIFGCLKKVRPVSLRWQGWLRSFDDLGWLNQCVSQSIICACAWKGNSLQGVLLRDSRPHIWWTSQLCQRSIEITSENRKVLYVRRAEQGWSNWETREKVLASIPRLTISVRDWQEPVELNAHLQIITVGMFDMLKRLWHDDTAREGCAWYRIWDQDDFMGRVNSEDGLFDGLGGVSGWWCWNAKRIS